MAKAIRRSSSKLIALILAASMIVFYASLVDTSQAAQVTNRSDTLNNANSSATSNHGIVFTVQDAVDAGDTVTVTIDASFTMGSIDCGDVDLDIAGVATTIAVTTDRNANTTCAQTTTSWGLTISGQTLTFTAPSAAVSVAAATQVMVKIGSAATFQDTGAEWITNPVNDGFYTMTIAGTFGGTGSILVAIIDAVQVSATIAETLTFTLTGLPGHSGVAGSAIIGACVNNLTEPSGDDDDGISVDTVTTTATTVPFGTINVSTMYQGCLKTAITTNAGSGFTIRTRENSSLRTGAGVTIPDANCDSDGCLNTPSTSAAFGAAGADGLGISCFNATTSASCSTTEPVFAGSTTSGIYFAPIGNESKGQTPGRYAFVSGATTVEVVTKAKFRLRAPATQAAGTYTNQVSFIATPVF